MWGGQCPLLPAFGLSRQRPPPKRAAPHLPEDPLSELVHPSSAPGTQCHPSHGCHQLPVSPGTAHWSCHLQENPTPSVFSQFMISVQRKLHFGQCAKHPVLDVLKCSESLPRCSCYLKRIQKCLRNIENRMFHLKKIKKRDFSVWEYQFKLLTFPMLFFSFLT